LLPPNPELEGDLDQQKQRSRIDTDWHFGVRRKKKLLGILVAVNRLLNQLGNFGVGLGSDPDFPSRSACCESVR
jgi:hypothetical protein